MVARGLSRNSYLGVRRATTIQSENSRCCRNHKKGETANTRETSERIETNKFSENFQLKSVFAILLQSCQLQFLVYKKNHINYEQMKNKNELITRYNY